MILLMTFGSPFFFFFFPLFLCYNIFPNFCLKLVMFKATDCLTLQNLRTLRAIYSVIE